MTATAAERRALPRYADAAVVRQYAGYFARPWTTGDMMTARHAFACECGHDGCEADVELLLAAFPAGAGAPDPAASAVLAPGHRLA